VVENALKASASAPTASFPSKWDQHASPAHGSRHAPTSAPSQSPPPRWGRVGWGCRQTASASAQETPPPPAPIRTPRRAHPHPRPFPHRGGREMHFDSSPHPLMHHGAAVGDDGGLADFLLQIDRQAAV